MFDFGLIVLVILAKSLTLMYLVNKSINMVFGFESSFELNDIDYEWAIGYIHGLTDASANHSIIWNFEIEF